MTLAGLLARNALRNKRRSALTIISIAFSLLRFTLMMSAAQLRSRRFLSQQTPWPWRRERTREVAVLKALGFTERSVLALFAE